MSNYILIGIILIILLVGIKNKVNCFDSFLIGAKDGLRMSVNMFSALLTFSIALCFLLSSGLLKFIENILNINYSLIIIQAMIRPLSSSSSMSIMIQNYETYGVDNVISIISSMIHYVSDATLYIVPFYCGMYSITKYDKMIILGVVINIFSYIVAICICLVFYQLDFF